MQVCRMIRLALVAAAVSYGGGAAAHEFPFKQQSDIRALGHDPEWTLAIDGAGGKLNLMLDGQSESYKLPKLGPSLDNAQQRMIYRVPNDRTVLHVFVTATTCRDASTGKSHEVSVLISRDGKGFAGCGDVVNR